MMMMMMMMGEGCSRHKPGVPGLVAEGATNLCVSMFMLFLDNVKRFKVADTISITGREAFCFLLCVPTDDPTRQDKHCPLAFHTLIQTSPVK